MVTVPRLWPNSTTAILASGPSLCQEDVDYLRGRCKVIAVNLSYRMALWADLMYACDSKLWRWVAGAPEFTGLKYALTQDSRNWCKQVQVLKATGLDGLETRPHGLKTGRNSGYQAINLAVHLGAVRILMLGYDMQRGPNGETHWHGDHQKQGGGVPFSQFRQHFPSLVKPLRAAGVEILNCSRVSALDCFKRVPLREALPANVEVAA